MSATPSPYGDGVACVVITYSPGDTLESFLQSVTGASDRPVTVVVSDNGSTDGAPERAHAVHPGLLMVSNPENPGYGTAANRGAAVLDRAIGWVIVCNPDMVFATGAIDLLVDALREDARIGTTGPAIRTAEGDLYPSARQLPSLRTGIAHAVLVNTWPSNPWTRRYKQESLIDHREENLVTGWLSGACLAIRRDAFDAVGGFDPGYFMYFEDVDLCARIARAGWQNVYVPRAEVVHSGAASTSRHAKAMLAAHHRSAYRYVATKHPERRWAPARAVIRFGLSLRLWYLGRRS